MKQRQIQPGQLLHRLRLQIIKDDQFLGRAGAQRQHGFVGGARLGQLPGLLEDEALTEERVHVARIVLQGLIKQRLRLQQLTLGEFADPLFRERRTGHRLRRAFKAVHEPRIAEKITPG